MDDQPVDRGRRRADVTDALLVGGVERRELFLVEHDPEWADVYSTHEARVRSALGDLAIAVEHIGSTSVPGLAAKPIIDVLVTVPDITAEEEYLEPLVALCLLTVLLGRTRWTDVPHLAHGLVPSNTHHAAESRGKR